MSCFLFTLPISRVFAQGLSKDQILSNVPRLDGKPVVPRSTFDPAMTIKVKERTRAQVKLEVCVSHSSAQYVVHDGSGNIADPGIIHGTIFKATYQDSSQPRQWTKLTDYQTQYHRTFTSCNFDDIVDPKPDFTQHQQYAVRIRLYTPDTSGKLRFTHSSIAELAGITAPPLAQSESAQTQAGTSGIFLEQPTGKIEGDTANISLKWQFTERFYKTLGDRYYATNIYVHINSNPPISDRELRAAGFVTDHELKGLSLPAQSGILQNTPLGVPQGLYYLPHPDGQNFGTVSGKDPTALNKARSITIRGLPGKREDGRKQGYTFDVVVARAEDRTGPDTYVEALRSNSRFIDVTPEGEVQTPTDAAGRPLEGTAGTGTTDPGQGSPCQQLGVEDTSFNPISNAIKQLQCTIANLYAELMKWLLQCWVLNAAKVEDLAAAKARGGAAGAVGGCIETDTPASGGAASTTPSAASGATAGTESAPVLGPPPLTELLKQKEQERVEREQRNRSGTKPRSSLRPLLHFALGVKPAQATLAQELREGGPAEWVVTAWRAVLAAVNSFAAIVLLVIAIANIAHINVEAFGFRRALPAMIVGVVLANFSLTLIRFLLDLSNGFSLAIVDAQRLVGGLPADDIATVISNGLAAALGPGASSGTQILTGTWASFLAPLGDLAGFFVSIILLTIAAIALLLVGAVLWARIVIIFVLTILAPLALFFYPLPFPQLQEQSKKWLVQMVNWVFVYPVIIFFLWLGTLAGQATASAGGATIIGYATLLILLFFAFMAPFKLIGIGEKAMESLLKKGPGALYGGAWGTMGRLADNPRAGQFGRAVGRAFRATNLAGVPGAVRQRLETGAKMTEAEAKRSPIARLIAGPGFRDRKEMMSEYRDKWGQEADVTRLRNRLNQLTPGKQPISAQSLLNASSDRDFAAFANQGWTAEEAIEAQAVMRQLNNTRRNGQTPAIRTAADTEWNNLVSPTATPTPGQPFTLFMGGAQARSGQVETPTDRLQTMMNVADIDPVEARVIVERIEAQGGEADLDQEIDRGLGAVDGRGGGRVGTELQGIAPGARKRLASIMSGILDPAELRNVLAQDDELKGLTPAQLTAVMATQEQISPSIQAKQNLDQLRLKSGLGNLNEQQEFGRQHAGFEAPIVRGNIGRLDQALQLVNSQQELTPDFQRQLQGVLAGVQVKTTDPKTGNVRVTSLDRTLGSTVMGDRSQLIRTLTNQRAGAQAVVANPGQPVETIFRGQGAQLVSRSTANQTVGQVVKLVGETAPENIKTAIGQPNYPLRKNLRGTVQTNVRSFLEQQGVKVQANNPEFNRRVNQTVEQLVGTIGNNLTPGQRVNAKQMQTEVELQMQDAVTKNFGQFLQSTPTAPQPTARQPVTGGNKQRQAVAATPPIVVPPAAPAPRSVTTEAELTARGPAKGTLKSAKELAKGRATTGGPTPTTTAEGPKSVPTTEDTVIGETPK